MSFDDFLIWVDEKSALLKKHGVPKSRRQHIQRLCRTLVGAECYEINPWVEVARKIAVLLDVEPPDRPEGEPSPAGIDAATSAAGPAVADSREKRPRAKSWREERRPKRKRVEPPKLKPIERNAELESAFHAVATGKPIIFVTGGAGTGKSTFIRALKDEFQEKQTVVLAPTGVAALTAGGQTIHSFCSLPLRPVTAEDIRKIDDPDERKVVESIELLIVDEISMVRADVLDGLELFLRINRNNPKPFGGVQLVLVGDLFQLPPVVRREDEEFLYSRYSSPFFFSANALRGLSFFPIELQIVYRQRDPRFKELLRSLRDGDRVDESVRALNELCVGRSLSEPFITLVPTRKAAAMENEKRLAALGGKEHAFLASSDGSFSSRGDDALPAPLRLALKKDAQVMFTRNDPEKRWVNGTLGTVDQLRGESIRVRLDNDEIHDVPVAEWQDIRYSFDASSKSIVEELVGTFIQFPLIPAWAVTIHKAQGLTLARVAVDLGRGAFAEGQVYVALSRAESAEGLSLTRPVRPREVRCSEAARAFYAKIQAVANRASRIAHAEANNGADAGSVPAGSLAAGRLSGSA